LANKVFDFLLSGINSLVKLGKGGNTLESHLDSHVEFKKPNGELVNVRTANPIDLKDSVNLEFLRENVLLSYGAPVQNLAQLRAIPLSQRRDKQIRLVEDEQAFYQFDAESMLVVPNSDNPKLAVLPNDVPLALPGRWIKSRGRTQYHADLIGIDSGDDHPQYQLRNEKDQPTGYLGLDNNGRLNATTDELDEGGDNQYFTPERAREASVEDEINEGEKEKAPSQDAVFQELADKEPNLPSGAPNEFLDGTKNFRNVEIQDIPGLEFGIQLAYDQIDILDATKEPSLPSGAPGTYLHSDKTFKQIDYSEIVGTPPESGGGGASTFLDLTDTPAAYPPARSYISANQSSTPELEYRFPSQLREDVFGVVAFQGSTTNLNTFTTPGIFGISFGSTATGVPFTLDGTWILGGYLKVIRSIAGLPSELGMIQIFYPSRIINTGGGLFQVNNQFFNSIYIRREISNPGQWDLWVRIPTFRANRQFEFPHHARLNLASDAILPLGTGNATLACTDASIFEKSSGTATITITNMGIGQSIVLVVTNGTTVPYTLTFASNGTESFRWQNGEQPSPTLISNSRDIYTFLKVGNIIYGSFLGDMR
jgi:hypothetical protein